MKTPKFVKALLLSSALLTMASPAYADMAYTPLSNTIKASFQVEAVSGPSFVLKWVDANDIELDTLPLQTVTSGESKDLKIRATVSQDYSYIRYYFQITRTDGTTIDENDVTLTQYRDSGPASLSGNVDDQVFLAYSKSFSTVASPSMDTMFNIAFNTAGDYQINVVAVSLVD